MSIFVTPLVNNYFYWPLYLTASPQNLNYHVAKDTSFQYLLFLFLICSVLLTSCIIRTTSDEKSLSSHMLVLDIGRYSVLYYSGGLVNVTEDEI